jgi:hypothetical protein
LRTSGFWHRPCQRDYLMPPLNWLRTDRPDTMSNLKCRNKSVYITNAKLPLNPQPRSLLITNDQLPFVVPIECISRLPDRLASKHEPAIRLLNGCPGEPPLQLLRRNLLDTDPASSDAQPISCTDNHFITCWRLLRSLSPSPRCGYQRPDAVPEINRREGAGKDASAEDCGHNTLAYTRGGVHKYDRRRWKFDPLPGAFERLSSEIFATAATVVVPYQVGLEQRTATKPVPDVVFRFILHCNRIKGVVLHYKRSHNLPASNGS